MAISKQWGLKIYEYSLCAVFKWWQWPGIIQRQHITTDSPYNSLAPGIYESKFKCVIFQHILEIKFMTTTCETTLRLMSRNTFDDMSGLMQLMVGCRQAASYYPSQCWSRSQTSYSVIMLQSVKWRRYIDTLIQSIAVRHVHEVFSFIGLNLPVW